MAWVVVFSVFTTSTRTVKKYGERGGGVVGAVHQSQGHARRNSGAVEGSGEMKIGRESGIVRADTGAVSSAPRRERQY